LTRESAPEPVKAAIIGRLQRESPDLARAAEVADFVCRVFTNRK
jgi:hypothetical protein